MVRGLTTVLVARARPRTIESTSIALLWRDSVCCARDGEKISSTGESSGDLMLSESVLATQSDVERSPEMERLVWPLMCIGRFCDIKMRKYKVKDRRARVRMAAGPRGPLGSAGV